MSRQRIVGKIAVVAPTRESARAAVAQLARRLRPAELVAFSASSYLREPDLLPAILAATASGADSARRFLIRARERILWPAPPPDLYAAIAGVVTRLPPPQTEPARAGDAEGLATTALLLEGEVDLSRARSALASPARHWIVDHPGRVRLSASELSRLALEGVVWSALEPVRLLGVAAPPRAAADLFPGIRLFVLR